MSWSPSLSQNLNSKIANNKKEPSLGGHWTSKLHLKIRICLELQRKGRQMLTSLDKRKRFLPYCWLTLAILSKAALCWVATGVVKVLYIKLTDKTKRRRELRVNRSIVIKVLSVLFDKFVLRILDFIWNLRRDTSWEMIRFNMSTELKRWWQVG